MSYATNADLQQRLGTTLYTQLTDDTGSGVPDENKATEARLGAEGEMDSYFARRYAVPVAIGGRPELTGVLRSIALDLAEYRLRCRRPPVDAEARRRQEAAVTWLRRVAAGEALLPSSTTLTPNVASGLIAATAGGPRRLTADEMDDL